MNAGENLQFKSAQAWVSCVKNDFTKFLHNSGQTIEPFFKQSYPFPAYNNLFIESLVEVDF